jgi:uncharacterized FlaG/YvyC family protein
MFSSVSLSFPVMPQGASPVMNPAPAGADTIDNPAQSINYRQPLDLQTERPELASETQNPRAQPQDETNEEPQAPTATPMEVPEASNAGVTYRILEELNNRVQSRVVDQATREVLWSVPPDQLVSFYARFHQAGQNLDVES